MTYDHVAARRRAMRVDAVMRTLLEVELMQEIAAYNEVDCRAMMEIVRYLRGQH